MKTPLLSLHEWLRRLGQTDARGEQPPIIEAVQPVALVADWSALVAPLRPPTAFGGNRLAIALGNQAAAQILCRAKGGAYIRWWSFTADAPTVLFWSLRGGIYTLTNPFPIFWRPVEVQTTAIQSTGDTGDVAGNLFSIVNGSPNVSLAAGQTFIGPPFYLHPGMSFGAFCGTVNVAGGWGFQIEEVTGASRDSK